MIEEQDDGTDAALARAKLATEVHRFGERKAEALITAPAKPSVGLERGDLVQSTESPPRA